MGTRTQIVCEGSNVLCYKHWDGYPTQTLPLIAEFTAFFFKERGYDPPYFQARLLMFFGRKEEERRVERIAAIRARIAADGDPTGYDESRLKDTEIRDVTGFGVDSQFHGDIEWVYVVTKDGTIEIRRPGGSAEHGTDEDSQAEALLAAARQGKLVGKLLLKDADDPEKVKKLAEKFEKKGEAA